MIGQTISHFKIVEKLGEGGMGVVYKATDTKLDRTVALKFLPDHVTVGSGELERFVQEAKAAAGLNHPNICTIYGIEESENKHFIVMEFVDGQTLQEKKSSLSMKQALDVGIQIAEGLAAAHEKGIVHRDIKPENIMFRKDGRVQIMDFGLAKLRGASRLTKEGSTVGTAGYMSPEQVQGQETDHRSDIFSLGVLLYEMLTGQPPFKGVHETAIAYEIVNVDSPPMSSLKPEIPPELDAIVLECLEKDPNERAQSARQVAIDLKRYKRESSRQRASRITAARPAMSASRLRPALAADERDIEIRGGISTGKLWMAVAGVAAVMLCAGYGISLLKGSPADIPTIRSSIVTPPGIKYYDTQGGSSGISPDGTEMALVCTDSLSHQNIYIRSMAIGDMRVLAGTQSAQYLFWSFDSKSIGFFADGKLKTIDAKGGPVIEIANAPFGRGGAWSKNGTILFSPDVADPNLYAVTAAGKSTKKVTAFDSASGYAPRFPFFLPDGRLFLFSYLEMAHQTSRSGIYVGSLDDTTVLKILDNAEYAMYSSGYLFCVRQGILLAQPFDDKSFALSGSPVSIQGNINIWAARAKADYSVSDRGVLVYGINAAERASDLFWVNANGTESRIGTFDQPFATLALSPDETRIAYDKVDATGNSSSIFIYDLRSKTTSGFTYASSAVVPCWSRDGQYIFYLSQDQLTTGNVRRKRSDGSGDATIVVQDNKTLTYLPVDVSPDDRYLLLSDGNQAGAELSVVDLRDPHVPHAVEHLGLMGGFGKFSSDGKWILYGNSLNTPSKIYVSSFKGVSGKWQLPSDGVEGAYWGKGRIVYYSASNERFEQCDIGFTNGIPAFGQPKPLFSSASFSNLDLYAVSRDGKRYLCLRRLNSGGQSSLSMVVNWKGLVNSN